MANDERNFRSAYYEKVGFRSVEEKKSLEILLKDKPLDRAKLKQFCLRFSVPTSYRNLIWKLLLGVVPIHIECHPFIMEQKYTEFKNLEHSLTVMKIVDSNTSKPHLFLAVWLLQTGSLRYEVNFQAQEGFVLIARSLSQFFDNDAEVFWLAKHMYGFVQKIGSDIPKLVETTLNLLEREDSALYKHLQNIGVLSNLPLVLWFESCIAGLLNESALGKIWDKLCGGCYKIFVFVIVVMMTNQRHRLLKCTNLVSVLHCLTKIPEEISEVIANKSIEMWQQHGSPLTIHDKPKP